MELRIEQVSKHFKDKEVVNDVSLTLSAGVWELVSSFKCKILSFTLFSPSPLEIGNGGEDTWYIDNMISYFYRIYNLIQE